MNNIIETVLGPKIKELPWVSHYGGLTFLVEDGYCDENGKWIKTTYPLTCNATPAECTGERFEPLEPSEDYKSLIYFEPEGNENIKKGQLYGKNGTWYDGKIRLICWFDSRFFNGPFCDKTQIIIPNLVYCLCCKGHAENGAYVEITGGQKESKTFTRNNIFGAYSYSKLADCKRFFLYPYDFFSITFNYKLFMQDNCGVLETGVTCVEVIDKCELI